MADVYYEPEAFDLETLAELVLTVPDYSFDIAAVWHHIPTGDLYFATDAGCSCPTPFEEYTSLESLTRLTADTYGELENETRHCDRPGARMDFLRKVRESL